MTLSQYRYCDAEGRPLMTCFQFCEVQQALMRAAWSLIVEIIIGISQAKSNSVSSAIQSLKIGACHGLFPIKVGIIYLSA
jgi:hypothetical protein